MRVLDLFSGIGGFSLGLERAGFETVAFCEIEPYAKKVLDKNWPGVPIYDDIRELTADRLLSDGIVPDVICGGFPCQDISVAGKAAGIDGERSGLWSECARLLGEVRPRYAIFENVTNLLNGEGGDWFKRVLWDISQVGYDAEWHCIPASQLGAHHHRDRVWIIAYPNDNGLPTTEKRESSTPRDDSHSAWTQPTEQFKGCGTPNLNGLLADTHRERLQGREEYGIFGESGERWQKLLARCLCRFGSLSEIEPVIRRGADGIPSYAHRIKCLGNSVVPAIPELIGLAILEVENKNPPGIRQGNL